MPNAMTASALALLSLVGTILGIDLGRSTIAQINPAYYSSPPPGHLYAELTPQGYRAGSNEPAVAEPWPYDGPGSVPVCVDCPTVASVDRYAEPDGRSETWQPSEPLPQVIRGIPQGELDRYMEFPVTQDEAREQSLKAPPRYAKRDVTEESEPDAEPEPDGL